MGWKNAARVGLHQMGGLAALRFLSRQKFRVLMFHEFHAADRPNLETICAHISNHFEPVSLSTILTAITTGKTLPAGAVAVTVDDGYRNYLLDGHPIFRKYRIPVTIYPVAGFANGDLWLWTDKVQFAIDFTSKKSVCATIGDQPPMELSLSSKAEKAHAADQLWEALKLTPNEVRIDFIERIGELFGVEIPDSPPAARTSLSWEEMRALTAEDVEIGCHTYSHPILSRLKDSAELEREVRGAKEIIEERMQKPVIHFCYPNGRDIDIGKAADNVKAAGYGSAVTCTWGLNSLPANPLHVRRVPLDSTMEPGYAAELMAGMHHVRGF